MRPRSDDRSSVSNSGGERETIFALASGIGRSAVSIIRISGAGTGDAVAALLAGKLPAPRRASLRRLLDPKDGEQIDQAMVLWMPGPGTFTGEDQAELHIHGSPAVRGAVARILSGLPGCRPAEPGEFTHRAFLNGKLDLTAVEGLADLIEAETEAQRRQAVRQLEGRLAAEVASWRDRLIDALASCEAALDFSDEDDVPEDVASGAAVAAARIRTEIAGALAGAARGERVREGFHVVIAGPPNAGKSTLLNALARRDVAIVSAVPGTTRDSIEVRCDLGGMPVTFVDTAGLRETEDAVEREGIARTRSRIQGADLVLWLVPLDGEGIDSDVATRSGEGLRVGTKLDLGYRVEAVDVAVSAATGEGLQELLQRVQDAASRVMGEGSDAVLTRERHRIVLESVVACLDRAIVAAGGGATELLAEDLRLALRHLGRMTGAVDVEEVLDRIFSSFCIGK